MLKERKKQELMKMTIHILKDWTVGCVVMLLRNLNPPKLCNRTRIQITSLHDHLIRGKILSGQYKGKGATIPRIPIIPTGYPFQFKRISVSSQA